MTYQDYQKFQTVYREIYDTAESQTTPFTVHYPISPLNDRQRNVRIGDYPSASHVIDTEQAKLAPLTAQ